MGKKDGGNRTKGNAKVASSARSAQILGNNATGFIGFGTNAESGFVPLLQSDDGVPPDFRYSVSITSDFHQRVSLGSNTPPPLLILLF